MVQVFVEWLINNLAQHNNYNETQKEEIKYVLKVLIYEFIKLALISSIFLILGYFKECIIVVMYMFLTKPFTGGYHEDNQKKCFLATFVVIAFIIILDQFSNLSVGSCIILNIISLFSIYNQVPIINEKMPLTKKELIKRNRIIAIINNSILLLISIIFYKMWFSNIIVWTGIVQTMLLFNKYKKEE